MQLPIIKKRSDRRAASATLRGLKTFLRSLLLQQTEQQSEYLVAKIRDTELEIDALSKAIARYDKLHNYLIADEPSESSISETLKELPRRIIELRLKGGPITLDALSKRCGIPKPTLSDYEKRQFRRVTLARLMVIAEALESFFNR